MNGIYRTVDMGPLGGALPHEPPAQVALRPATVETTHAGGMTLSLSHDWLRDNCPCLVCRIAQTDERRLKPWEHPAPVATSAVLGADGALRIVWADGHESVYAPDWWEATDRRARRGAYSARLWRGGYELARFAHDDVLNDLAVRLSMFEAFRRDGAVVVHHAPTVPGTVIEFMRAIDLTLLDSSLGFIFDVQLDPDGFNIAFTHESLPLHNDNGQYLRPPSGQVLSMVVNEATGGESQVADGWCILEQLRERDPDALEVLASVEVGLRQYSATADGFCRAPLVVRDPLGRFTHLRFSNQLMQPVEHDHPRLAEWYDAYRALGALIHEPGNHIEFRLNGGDMLLVDGYRVLHARNAFVPDGPRHLQDVYFETQDVADQLARLTGLARNAMVR